MPETPTIRSARRPLMSSRRRARIVAPTLTMPTPIEARIEAEEEPIPVYSMIVGA